VSDSREPLEVRNKPITLTPTLPMGTDVEFEDSVIQEQILAM